MRQPAPSYNELYQVESHVSAAVVALLDDESTPAHGQRSLEDLQTPFYTVQVVGSSMTEQNAILAGRRPRRNTWVLSLSVTAVTNRTEEAQADATVSHAEMVGDIREMIHGWAELFDEVALPYHEVLDCVETGSSVGYSGETDRDTTTITFEMTVAIAATSWPV